MDIIQSIQTKQARNDHILQRFNDPELAQLSQAERMRIISKEVFLTPAGVKVVLRKLKGVVA